MPFVSRALVALSLLASIPACSSPRPATEMVITVDADASVRAMATSLLITVEGRAGTGDYALTGEYTFDVAADGTGWPRVVVVFPAERDVRRSYRVTATAFSGPSAGDEVATVRLISGYVDQTTLRFRLYLQGSCIGVDCSLVETCRDGACIPAMVDPGTLVDGGTPIEMDAGGMDAPGVACDPVDCSDGIPCTVDTCVAGTCMHASSDALCDDDVDCTADACTASGCENVAQPSFCLDTETCTVDACDPTDPEGDGTGCTHVDAMDDTGCDDGVFCNGSDVCIGGACSGHAGGRCMPPLTCDEANDECDGCTTTADCDPPETGAYSECAAVGPCVAERARPITTYTCVDMTCEPSTRFEFDRTGCTSFLDGAGCGSPSCFVSGVCGGFDDECDMSGLQEWTCTPAVCAGGTCSGTGTAFTMDRGCGRMTEGRDCGACGTCTGGVCTGTAGSCDGGTGPTDVPCFDAYSCTEDYWNGSFCDHFEHDEWCPLRACETGVCDPGAVGSDPNGCVYYASDACGVDSGPPPPGDAGPGYDGGGTCDAGSCPCQIPPAFGGTPCATFCEECRPGDPAADWRGCVYLGGPCGFDAGDVPPREPPREP